MLRLSSRSPDIVPQRSTISTVCGLQCLQQTTITQQDFCTLFLLCDLQSPTATFDVATPKIRRSLNRSRSGAKRGAEAEIDWAEERAKAVNIRCVCGTWHYSDHQRTPQGSRSSIAEEQDTPKGAVGYKGSRSCPVYKARLIAGTSLWPVLLHLSVRIQWALGARPGRSPITALSSRLLPGPGKALTMKVQET